MIEQRIVLDHGSGGRSTNRLIRDLFLRYFSNPLLSTLDDAACFSLPGPLAMSTDGYTVDPLEFPGGDIGALAVHGTVNDLAMLGAKAKYLSACFIIEEGLPMQVLERVVSSMADAAREAGVWIIAGDTKVVPRKAADKLFISTAGIGVLVREPAPSGSRACPGDAILLSGYIGDHGLAVLSARDQLWFNGSVQSDAASLHRMACTLVWELADVHVLRDPTRGGVACALNEIADQSQVACLIHEELVPIRAETADACALLGLDPLYLANEGKMLCFIPQADAAAALAVMRRFPEGKDAVCIGEVLAADSRRKPGQVIFVTALGGQRLVRMLEGEHLPRIC